MSADLLRRLGERALGGTPALRPAVSPLFASAPSPSALVSMTEGDFTAVADDVPANAPAEERRSPSRMTTRPDALVQEQRAPVTRSGPHGRERELDLNALPDRDRDSRPYEPDARPASARRSESSMTAPNAGTRHLSGNQQRDGDFSNAHARQAPEGASRTTVPPARDSLRPRAPSERPRAPSERPRAPSERPRAPSERPLPPASRGAEDLARAVHRLSGLRMADGFDRAQPEAPPVVRVTIGRIEVRTASQARAPLRAPERAPRRQGLSLDEYLSKPGGETA